MKNTSKILQFCFKTASSVSSLSARSGECLRKKLKYFKNIIDYPIARNLLFRTICFCVTHFHTKLAMLEPFLVYLN